jgi:apolipoprotein D and lipocalin family protein
MNMNESVCFAPLPQLALRATRALALGLSLTAATASVVLVPASAQAAPLPALQAVPSVDLTRYQGHWYQIALYPNSFQKQCVSHTTADYQLTSTGQVTVTNTCQKADGSTTSAVGAARIKQPRVLGVPVGAGVTSKLEVRFAPGWLSWVPGVWAPYWVIQLADDYRYAVVGEPGRQYLWILSRTPVLDPQDRAIINGLLQQQGYDPTRLQEEPQLPVQP